MTDTEKKYTTAYGKLRRLTSTIDCEIRQRSVSKPIYPRFEQTARKTDSPFHQITILAFSRVVVLFLVFFFFSSAFGSEFKEIVRLMYKCGADRRTLAKPRPTFREFMRAFSTRSNAGKLRDPVEYQLPRLLPWNHRTKSLDCETDTIASLSLSHRAYDYIRECLSRRNPAKVSRSRGYHPVEKWLVD